jgi:hypothetical protein
MNVRNKIIKIFFYAALSRFGSRSAGIDVVEEVVLDPSFIVYTYIQLSHFSLTISSRLYEDTYVVVV